VATGSERNGAVSSRERKIRIEQRFAWAHHRTGWDRVEAAVEAALASPRADTLFVGAVEQALLVSREPLRCPWIGISHQIPALAPGAEEIYGRKVANLDSVWDLLVASLPACRGLFTLSDSMRRRLGARLQGRVPLETLRHPTELDVRPFRFELYAADPDRRLIQLGHWGRLMRTIYEFEAPSHVKLWLPGLAFDAERLRKFVGDLADPASGVRVPPRVDDEEYDRFLERSLCLVPLFDSSANTALLECVARATPVLVNPLPAVVEYLGARYPLYFESLEEASQAAEDRERVRKAHLYLRRLPKDHLSLAYFVRRMAESRIYRSLPPPAPPGSGRGSRA
jgi:hypothetical protein